MAYKYIEIHKLKKSEPFLLEERVFRFKTENNQTYLVRLELYRHNIYAIKFHNKNHRHSIHKYHLLTGEGRARSIINTCLDIIAQVLQENPSASFGFVGSRTINPNISEELPHDTKRFNVYKRFMENKFSTDSFLHVASPDYSSYMLINKANDEPFLLLKYTEMFNKIYSWE